MIDVIVHDRMFSRIKAGPDSQRCELGAMDDRSRDPKAWSAVTLDATRAGVSAPG